MVYDGKSSYIQTNTYISISGILIPYHFVFQLIFHDIIAGTLSDFISVVFNPGFTINGACSGMC